ncbi:MAG: hypothetical protein K8R46_03740 [Pirellulales bacterium]|nr:hypothetical protein [Pirellulales bacterium]
MSTYLLPLFPCFKTAWRAAKFPILYGQCLNDSVLFSPCRGAVRDTWCESNPSCAAGMGQIHVFGQRFVGKTHFFRRKMDQSPVGP